MFITIYCSGMPFDGNTIKERSLGGSESAAYYMAKELANNGHKVTMFTNCQEEGFFDKVRYVPIGKPTKEKPLGEWFHSYAENTPVDVMIIQRHPIAFAFNWASKINLWWMHDLAQGQNRDHLAQMLWNIDGILTVSEWHKQQVVDTWGINPEIVMPITNGVDLSLFEGELKNTRVIQQAHEDGTPLKGGIIAEVPHSGMLPTNQIKLLYTSRPERGLENHVKPGGIMERLYEIDPNYHLYVCAYDNVTQEMAPYYDYLYQRCDELPNVTRLGSLNKQELADVMRQCDALVYPQTFQETSCITAMECMAAGLPMITSAVGAIPETVEGSGTYTIPLKDGQVDEDAFIEGLENKSWGLKAKGEIVKNTINMQLKAAKKYSWTNACDRLIDKIYHCFLMYEDSIDAKLKHMLRMSDIRALYIYLERPEVRKHQSTIKEAVQNELDECYGFAFKDDSTMAAHYAAYYEYEKNRGVNYGPENLDYNTRFECVAGMVADLPAGSTIADYGCAHGHYTINLAKRFPDKHFVGIDITASNVEKAMSWAGAEGLHNVEFIHAAVRDGEIYYLSGERAETALSTNKFDCIIAAEVIEHVNTPEHHIEVLNTYLKTVTGKMIITVPYGPWEAQGYEEHWPWRAHLHHFERADLHDMLSHFNGFNIIVAPGGVDKTGEQLGSYIVSYEQTSGVCTGSIDWERKFNTMAPRQTVSLCMIAKDAEDSILKAVRSVEHVVDEIIIAVDETTTDNTVKALDGLKCHVPVTFKTIKSPLEIGFDEARNEAIKDACGDFILWLDTDETISGAHNIPRYLRQNAFNGYAVKQHHFAVQPLGVMKTDMPVKLFRNHLGIKFFGRVHEHPEIKLNEGVGHAVIVAGFEIAHTGYENEEIRRNRFKRNLNLMVRDREDHPDRKLGKFLWLRDLSQMCGYELEQNGGHITGEMISRADRGIQMWEELLEDKADLRMVLDGMDYYNRLVEVKGGGIVMTFAVGSGGNVTPNTVTGNFLNKGHAEKLLTTLFTNEVIEYEKRYA